jgi:hypothetical protein
VVTQERLLGEERLALATAWDDLAEGRRSIARRKAELTEGDYIRLQLELIRLEKGVETRALEMRYNGLKRDFETY